MEKILHLTLKKKWFDMIASGEKKEEYREVKKYWAIRFVAISNYKGKCEGLLPNDNDTYLNSFYPLVFKKYDYIIFKNGYSKNAPTLKVKFLGIEIGNAKPEWSDNWQGKVFIIKLGEIINVQ